MPFPIAFAGSPLDRADARRRDTSWLAAQLDRDATRLLAFWRGQLLFRETDPPSLAWATPALREIPGAEGAESVFLGLEGDVAHFAVDLSELDEPIRSLGVEGSARFGALRALAARLPGADAAVAAETSHLLQWHARHRFCPACGAPSRSRDGGWVRACSDADCAALHFPRTDPVAIVVVCDGDRCLLGRHRGWAAPFHSALAGFIEPGETLEEAVRREVKEETAISLGAVRYQASQPWPFPASLMLGCLAEASSRKIVPDGVEIEAADWFTRQEVLAALAEPTDRLAVPPPLAIAHQLIRAWAQP